MPQLAENRELLQAFRRGDRTALSEVYGLYARPLFDLLARGFSFDSQGQRCSFGGYREPWRLESAVQEVFVRAFAPRARAAYDGLRPYRNYLFTIARNLVIDRYRRGDREQVHADTAGLADLQHDDSGDNPAEQQLVAQQLQQHINAFVDSLDAGEREIFLLRLRQGLAVEQVARQLKVSEHRVKRSSAALKKRFFHAMRQHGYFEGYRYGRDGIERAVTLLLLLAGGAR